MRFEINGLEEAARQPDPSIIVYTLANDILALPNIPQDENGAIPNIVHEVVAIARKPANALASFEQLQRRVLDDPTLSDVGRREKLAPAREAAQQVARNAQEELRAFEEKVAVLDAEVYAAPVLEPNDFVSALVDREIRDEVRRLKPRDLIQFLEQLPTNRRHLEALVRSPTALPIEVTNAAEGQWREIVGKTHPQAKAAEFGRLAVQWGRTVIPAIEARI